VVLGKYASGFGVEEARQYHEATYSIGLGAGRRFVRQVDLPAPPAGRSGRLGLLLHRRHPGAP
jgi:hypothetical protein